jgi:hypothetical protein
MFMKAIGNFLLVVSAALLFSCKGNGEIAEGLSVNVKGLTFERAYLTGRNRETIDRKNVAMESEVHVMLEGVSNYVLKDGNAFPGLNITVTDRNGVAVIDDTDMLSKAGGYSPAEASIIKGMVRVGPPMLRGETYHVNMKLWDHNKPENTITVDLDIVPQ